jgi:hypothetical protein
MPWGIIYACPCRRPVPALCVCCPVCLSCLPYLCLSSLLSAVVCLDARSVGLFVCGRCGRRFVDWLLTPSMELSVFGEVGQSKCKNRDLLRVGVIY